MPQNSEELVSIYKKVIDPQFINWVIFSKGDLKNEAIEVLKKYGSAIPGTPSSDFTVMKADNGWIVAGNQQ